MSPPNRNQRVLTGHVTKILGDGDSYGFIDEEIFFQQINVEKGPAKVNDRVYAECQYSENLPFKWNATKVKILKPTNPANSPNHSSSSESHHANNNKSPSSLNNQFQLPSQDTPGSNPICSTPMLPQQQQQQYNPHHHNQQPSGHSQDAPKKLLPPTTNPGEFFNPDIRSGVAPFLGQTTSDAFQQQQYQGHDSVPNMLNPGNKLTYTSQPGSAFVSSQFVPFIPPSALAPQAVAGGHHKSLNQDQLASPRNQGGGFQNKSSSQSRWNERDIDRNSERKSNNNNTENNRRDKSRMNDSNNNRTNRSDSGNRGGGVGGNRGSSGNRESINNKSHSNNASNNNSNNSNKGARNRDDRDRRSDGHKRPNRDDSNARSSPAPVSSAMSTTSNNSSSHGKTARRRYEPVNIPKAPLMIQRMNTFDIKQRYPSSLHIPSDLKEIAINTNFRFDITSIPKPICYKIEVSNKQSEDQSSIKSDLQADVSIQSQSVKTTNQSSSQEIKMLHKYGVKVILISIPTMEEIYKRLFGQNLDSYGSDKNYPPHFNSTVSFLCTKSLSGGSSLIGAKFDPLLDGFLPSNSTSGQSNRPNLIATCIRCVRDQTGLDLSGCTEWNHLATFIYNQKNDYFSSSASVEYSHIFMPDVWSLMTKEFEQEFSSTKDLSDTKTENVIDSGTTNLDPLGACDGKSVGGKDDSTVVKEELHQQDNESSLVASNDSNKVEDPDTSLNQANTVSDEKNFFDPDKLAELKVSDLKAELDRRNIKYKHGIKKAELVSKLKELIQCEDLKEKSLTDVDSADKLEEAEKMETSVDISAEYVSTRDESTVDELTKSTSIDHQESVKEEPGTKRKLDESLECQDEKPSKKLDLEEAKDVPVNLVTREFIVKPKGLTILTTVTLSQAVQPQKHDQFELSVVTNIFRDHLVQHFSEYIFTGLVAETQDRVTDSNDNSFKNPSKLNSDIKEWSSNTKSSSIDLPIDRYMNIAFTYFDSTHVGYLFVDDLNKIFLNSGYSISKRALASLVGESEKYYYKSLPDPSWGAPYKFPKQFSEYSLKEEATALSSIDLDSSNDTIEYKGVRYNFEKLIQQSTTSERIRVNMVERFNKAITKYDEQLESIKQLEASQKSLSNALNIQNEEICVLKRDKETLRKKYDHMCKSVESSISALTDLMKKDD